MAKAEKTATTVDPVADGVSAQSVVARKREKPLTALTVVTRMAGVGMPLAEKLVGKMTDEERTALVKAYETNAQPRGVLQRIRDRIADEALTAKAADQAKSSSFH